MEGADALAQLAKLETERQTLLKAVSGTAFEAAAKALGKTPTRKTPNKKKTAAAGGKKTGSAGGKKKPQKPSHKPKNGGVDKPRKKKPPPALASLFPVPQ